MVNARYGFYCQASEVELSHMCWRTLPCIAVSSHENCLVCTLRDETKCINSILTAVLRSSIRRGPNVEKKPVFPWLQGDRESTEIEKKSNKRINLRPCDKQSTLSPESVSHVVRPEGKMIHDLSDCNNTHSWPVLYIFHSSCSFNVSSAVKQGPFRVAAFFLLACGEERISASYARASPAHQKQPTRLPCDTMT